MQTDFLPRKQAEFRSWARNFTDAILIDPLRFHVSAAHAATLAEQFGLFDDAMALTSAKGTRCKRDTQVKDDARDDLTSTIRDIAGNVRESDIPAAEKIAMGVSVRPKRLSKRPAPTTAPVLWVGSVAWPANARVELQLRDADATSRKALPHKCCANLLYCLAPVGVDKDGQWDPPPISKWSFAGYATTHRRIIQFPRETIGRIVYITAQWSNLRGAGPWSAPVAASIQR